MLVLVQVLLRSIVARLVSGDCFDASLQG